MKRNKYKNKLVITWQRLISGGDTCPRCGNTENELDKAVSQLKEKLNPMGIEVILEKKELTLKEFENDPIQSNRILFNSKPLEDLIGAETGQSQCCDVCGNNECRTVKIKEELHETIPADIIVKAGLVAVRIEDFGYNAFFESNRKKLKLDDFSVARVIVENRGAYRVINQNGEFLAKITGKQMFNAFSREDYPAVGDWVAITELNTEQAVIQGTLPRKTIIKRKHGDRNKIGDKTEMQVIATNIDVAFVVESIDRDYNLNRFERYFAIARDGGVDSAIILNKTDLISKDELDVKLAQLKSRFNNIDVIPTSTISDEGLNKLRAYILSGKTYCFLGSSGVGKSSLINKLLGESIIKTDDISSYSGRGKHITTNREMYFLENGGIVIDNPGMREVGMADASAGIDSLFDEIIELGKKCKYADCTHIHEPGCEVLAMLKSGKLDKAKYSNYVNLKKEAEHYEMSEFEKKEKDRNFGKFLKKAKKEIKKYKY